MLCHRKKKKLNKSDAGLCAKDGFGFAIIIILYLLRQMNKFHFILWLIVLTSFDENKFQLYLLKIRKAVDPIRHLLVAKNQIKRVQNKMKSEKQSKKRR